MLMHWIKLLGSIMTESSFALTEWKNEFTSIIHINSVIKHFVTIDDIPTSNSPIPTKRLSTVVLFISPTWCYARFPSGPYSPTRGDYKRVLDLTEDHKRLKNRLCPYSYRWLVSGFKSAAASSKVGMADRGRFQLQPPLFSGWSLFNIICGRALLLKGE